MNPLFNLSTLIMTYQYSENLPAPARERYFSKLALVGLDKCPYKLPADVWIDDMKAWPDVQYPDIYHYLINFPRVYSPDAMMNYKSLESYRFFVAGLVGIVLHVITDLTSYIFRADVRPSYRINDEPHHPWVSVKKTGCIITGHCDCMAETYALDKYCYLCKDRSCDREFVCMRQMKATNNRSKRIIEIERYGEAKVLIHYGKCRFHGLLEAGYTLNKIVAACHRKLALLVLYHLQDFHTCNFAFPLVNLQTGTIIAHLTSPRQNMTVIHCQISPDGQYTAILFYSRSVETLKFSYDLYLYCNETEKVIDCVTINHEVHPYVAFDPRYKWSRLAIANYECKDAGIKHELVTYSISDHAVVIRSNMSLPVLFGSSHFNLLFSKDGQFLILQKLSDNRFGVTIYSDIYILDSDRLFVMKYLTCNLPALSSICRMNFEPAFSSCGTYMRVVDHKSSNGDADPTVQIYQVPRRQRLQYHCRVVILQSLNTLDDVNFLPLPKSIKQFLTFQPLEA